MWITLITRMNQQCNNKMRGSANIVWLSLKHVVYIIRKLPTLDTKNRTHQGIQSKGKATNALSICFFFFYLFACWKVILAWRNSLEQMP